MLSDIWFIYSYLHGGADTGFRLVKPEQYTPRLFHFHGDRKGVQVKEVIFIESYTLIESNYRIEQVILMHIFQNNVQKVVPTVIHIFLKKEDKFLY